MIPGLCSVVIPSYNHEDYVVSAIQSALDQTYGNMEVVVVDDGSKDNSLERIKEVKDERIVLHVQENQGAHGAINTGLSLARGEYLAILNSDDVYDRERIQKSLDHLTPRGKARFLSTWIRIIDKDGRQVATKKAWHNLDPWSIDHPEKSFRSTDDPTLNLLMWNYVATTSNFVMHRSLYEEVGALRNLRFVHDWDYALRVFLRERPVILEEPLLDYRIHDRNTISSDRRRMLFEICWVLAAHMPSYEGKHLFADPDREALLRDLEMLYESINLQGNDKLFWVMRSCMESLRRGGAVNPEEIVLTDPVIRDRLISMVRDSSPAELSPIQRILRSLRNILGHG